MSRVDIPVAAGVRFGLPPVAPQPACPVCRSRDTTLLGAVNFNKACTGMAETLLRPVAMDINYHQCGECEHVFAPSMLAWAPERFAQLVYNREYCLADPEYPWVRPSKLAANLLEMLGPHQRGHLDYGGGAGVLSELVGAAGWESVSWDPFGEASAGQRPPVRPGGYELVTAFEVFEHAPNPHTLIRELLGLLAPGGFVLFSTLLVDREVERGKPFEWWYAAPRNGHISLFSSASLKKLAAQYDYTVGEAGDGVHVLWRPKP